MARRGRHPGHAPARAAASGAINCYSSATIFGVGMNVHFIRATARMALLGTALSGLAACASAQQPEAARPAVQQVEDTQAASTPVTPPPPAPAARPASTVAELQSLIQNRQVSELRTTYNGTYGASLLFAGRPDLLRGPVPAEGFLARGQDPVGQAGRGHLPRFAGQSMELAEVDIQRIRLQAEYAHNEKLLASRNAQLSTLQAETRCACSRKSRSPPASNNRARKPPPWPTSRRTCASNCAICSARSTPCRLSRPSSAARARRPRGR